MLKTIKASIDKNGHVHLDERVNLKSRKKALVTILDDEEIIPEITLVSQESLSIDWDNKDENKAWEHLK